MISDFLLLAVWIFILLGSYGLFKFKGIYSRLLSSAKIDSVSIITLFLALIIKSGWSIISLKLMIILVFYLLSNPITNQIIACSAYKNGVLPYDHNRRDDQ